ncbi:SDR family NAD(P)-dependent oxidoreductase [Allomuricauda sp. F6463D]|uniref:SDR family NAD(P)-dependent oxidoreductase n=1 Tax=Allomuricauda sp. F6463D TaxID=2926409 RepID=UPI001FF2D80A|nr:SDR family oxidoreductase [Muricauda sp. F6463D]MCK0159310.1 SDR family oxidoreductase [Muricauda sp. F6463D]
MYTVMILGGAKGVGLEILKSCHKKGYQVAFCGRSEEHGKKIVDELNTSKNIYYHTLDLNNINGLESYHKETIKRFGKIDALIVYAGISPIATILDTTDEQFDNVFNINLKAPYFLLKHVLKHMKENFSGSIVFFGSPHMDYGHEDRAAYALTKSSLYTLSNHIAHHYAKFRIRSNYIVMGWTNTEGELDLREKEGMDETQLMDLASKHIPMGHILPPTEPVAAVMYLISNDSSMTTGSIIRITGGHFI